MRKDLKPDEIEIYEKTASSIIARSSLDKIEVCKKVYSHGFGLRVVKDGAIGFSYYSEEKEKEDAIKRAVKSARLSPNEKYSFPHPPEYWNVDNFDVKISALVEEDIVDMLLEAMDGASERASPSKGEVSATFSTTKITSSNGLEALDEDTSFSAFISAKAGESIGYDHVHTKKLDVNMRKLGENAGHWAAKSRGGKPIDFTGPIVLSVDVLSSFFSSCVLRNLNGENARRGKTLWQKGDEVMDKSITIIDNPSRPFAGGTVGFDDEGIPSKREILVDEGVVSSFLLDTRTANLMGEESTGNGFRASFASAPQISASNTIVSSNKSDEIFDEGLFVKELMGFHNMNPVTGDFALDIVQGFQLHKGEGGQPVRGCMLVGNFLDVLKSGPVFAKQEEGKDSFFSPKMRFEGKVVSK